MKSRLMDTLDSKIRRLAAIVVVSLPLSIASPSGRLAAQSAAPTKITGPGRNRPVLLLEQLKTKAIPVDVVFEQGGR